VRNSLRYVPKQHWAKVTAELKEIYTSPTVAAAEARFADFAATWRAKYPAMIAMWERSWAEFVPFLDYPIEIRKLIYTTDESVNRGGVVGSVCGAWPDRCVMLRPAAGVKVEPPGAQRGRTTLTPARGGVASAAVDVADLVAKCRVLGRSALPRSRAPGGPR
jgi:hypothetical protein